MKKLLLLLTMAFISLFVLAACGTDETTDTKDKKSSASEDSAFPVTIKHALGEATIKEKPERVVTIQWGNHDVALALGVVPVGFSAANFGVQDDSGLLPWTKDKLDELDVTDPNVFMDTDGLDFEAISDANPDVILAPYSGITEEDYKLLTEIAPVVAYPKAAWATTWRESVELTSTALGIKEDGDKLIKKIETSNAEKLTKYPQLENKKIAWVNFSADDLSKVSLYTPVDARVSFLEELGLTYPESITSLIEDPNSYSLEISAENAEALNDVAIIVGYGDAILLKAIQKDPLLGKIPAVKSGAVAFIEADTPLVAAGTPNPLSIEYTIDDYLTLLGGAVDNANK